jgi:hypothetical protein
MLDVLEMRTSFSEKILSIRVKIKNSFQSKILAVSIFMFFTTTLFRSIFPQMHDYIFKSA